MLSPITLTRDAPLQQQLYQWLRDLIESLPHGARMPSTRLLAEQVGVSRITVLLTYERLIAEGHLETRPATGTFVSRAAAPARKPVDEAPPPAAVSDDQDAAPDAVGRPDPALFPTGRWRRLMLDALNHSGAQRSDAPAGSPALRDALARWLATVRGIAVDPQQIILVNGRRHGLHLIAHLVRRRGARAVLENPGDPLVADALAGEGFKLLRVPVDRDGLATDRLPAGDAALIHVTPTHQRPLGVALAPGRRQALLAWAAHAGALVLKDDCDGELRYDGSRLPSLLGMGARDGVVLLAGFVSALGPWIKLCYLVMPEHLVGAALRLRHLLDDSHHALEEVALASLIDSGAYARHLLRLSRTYGARADALRAALQRGFGADTRIWGGQAGLRLTWLPPVSGAAKPLAALAVRCGLEAQALRVEAHAGAPACEAIALGFGALSETQIAARVAQFADVASSLPGVLAEPQPSEILLSRD